MKSKKVRLSVLDVIRNMDKLVDNMRPNYPHLTDEQIKDTIKEICIESLMKKG